MTTQEQATQTPASIYDAALAAITRINESKQLGMDEGEIIVAAKHLNELNEALKADRTVCLVCNKDTAWDKLSHYSIYYVNAKGRLTKLWLYHLTVALGGSRNKESSGLPAWTWTAYQYANEAADDLRMFLAKLGGEHLPLADVSVL